MAVDTVHPYRSRLSFGSSAGSTNALVAELREWEFTTEMEFLDATSNDSSGWREAPTNVNTRQMMGSWSISGTCVFNRSDPQNVYSLLSNLNTGSGNAGTASRVRLQLRDFGSTSTVSSIYGDAFLESYEVGADYEGIVLHDFTLRGVGEYTIT